MSLITGCPSCGTMFRVVPDQLKISEGWVRCGHCSQVFDGTAYLQQDPAPARDLAAAAAGLAERAPADVASQAPAAEAATPRAAFDAEPEPVPLADDAGLGIGTTAAGSATAERSEPAAADGSVEVDNPPPVLAEAPNDPAPGADDQPPVAPLRRESEPLPVTPAADGAEPALLEDVSFLRDARRRAFWQRRGVRAGLALAALALLALLAAQAAVHDRDRLALAQPALRPWLERLCQPLQCGIEVPRRIEALAIDSSGFAKLRPDSYRLSFTLKNNAQQPVAVPALELTLTDTQDQPVLRRVLLPAELGARADRLEPGADWSAAVTLAVDAGAANGRITGYRLLAFYP